LRAGARGGQATIAVGGTSSCRTKLHTAQNVMGVHTWPWTLKPLDVNGFPTSLEAVAVVHESASHGGYLFEQELGLTSFAEVDL
jgi:hypothetical protein